MEKLKKWFNRIGGFEYGCKEREKKIRNKLPKGSIILFLVVMLLDLCVLMIMED